MKTDGGTGGCVSTEAVRRVPVRIRGNTQRENVGSPRQKKEEAERRSPDDRAMT